MTGIILLSIGISIDGMCNNCMCRLCWCHELPIALSLLVLAVLDLGATGHLKTPKKNELTGGLFVDYVISPLHIP